MKARDENLWSLVYGEECRRAVLDKMMDGVEERTSCWELAGEEPCDVCQKDWSAGSGVVAASGLGSEEVETEEGDETMVGDESGVQDERAPTEDIDSSDDEAVKEHVINNSRLAAAHGLSAREQERNAVMASNGLMSFAEHHIPKLDRTCILCIGEKTDDGLEHMPEQCSTMAEDEELGELFWKMQAELGKIQGQHLMDQFVGCYWCLMPYHLCSRWEQEDELGQKFKLSGTRRCRYPGLVVRTTSQMHARLVMEGKMGFREVVKEAMAKERWVEESEDTWLKYLGRKVRCIDVECTMMFTRFLKYWKYADQYSKIDHDMIDLKCWVDWLEFAPPFRDRFDFNQSNRSWSKRGSIH